MSKTLSIRLPEELALWIEEQARLTGRSRGTLVREALERARSTGDKPFMKWAGTVEGPSDLSQRRGFSRS